jgi:hypothetical protein
MLQGKKKKSKKTEEEGDGRCHCLLREATLLEERKEGDGIVAAIAYFAALQHSSIAERRRRRQLAVAVTFFMALRCSATPQQRRRRW